MGVSFFTLRDFLLVILFFLFSVLVWSFFYQDQSERALYNPDAYSFGVVAKEVVRGNGFQTKSLILPQLAYLQQTGKDVTHWDSLYNFPFPVLIMSFLFLLFGLNDFPLSLSSGIFYFLSAPLIYLIARKRFNRTVATFSTLSFIFFPHILRYSISGMTELPSIFFTLLLVYLFTFQPNRFTLVAAGLILGLFYLNRHTSLIFLPLFLALIYQDDPQSKWRNWSWFTIPFLLVILPWWWHMYSVTGNPLFHLGASILIPNQTSLFPDFHVNLYPYYASPVEFILKYPELVLVKYLQQSFLLNWVLFSMFFLIRKKLGKFDRLLLWLFLLIALIQPLFGNNPRYYALFAPLVLMYITGAVESFLRRYSFANPALRTVILTGLLVLVSWSSLRAVWHGMKGERVFGRGSGMVEHKLDNMQILNQLIDRNELLATNICSEASWYSDSKALTLPPDPDSLSEFEQKYGLSLDQIYLSIGLYMPGLTPPGWAKWEQIRQNGELPGYEARYRFDNGSLFLKRTGSENG
jgi:4-amino-4-deoxy-L-arabinose transferase-like glycosyltransferase